MGVYEHVWRAVAHPLHCYPSVVATSDFDKGSLVLGTHQWEDVHLVSSSQPALSLWSLIMTWIWLYQALAEESWPLGEDNSKIKEAHKVAQLVKEFATKPGTMSPITWNPRMGGRRELGPHRCHLTLYMDLKTKIQLSYIFHNEKRIKEGWQSLDLKITSTGQFHLFQSLLLSNTYVSHLSTSQLPISDRNGLP